MRAYGARPLLLGGALLGIVVVSALAVRESMRNAHERKAAAERTVKDFAKFASYIYTSRAYLFARDRTLFQAYVALHPSEPWPANAVLPPPSVIPAIPDTTERCGPAENWPIYRFRIDLPSRTPRLLKDVRQQDVLSARRRIRRRVPDRSSAGRRRCCRPGGCAPALRAPRLLLPSAR